MTKIHFLSGVILFLGLLSNASFAAEPALLPTVIKPAEEITYLNKAYHFSFVLPTGWEKQSGRVNSHNALFMQMPISNSCSFQFNVTPMSASFPAEVAVTTALAAAQHEARVNKLLSAKRRDTVHREKIKEKRKEKEKITIITRGWQITEKAKHQQQQRIIYQVYDRQNRHFDFIAAAVSEKFATCAPELYKIINSISFAL